MLNSIFETYYFLTLFALLEVVSTGCEYIFLQKNKRKINSISLENSSLEKEPPRVYLKHVSLFCIGDNVIQTDLESLRMQFVFPAKKKKIS